MSGGLCSPRSPTSTASSLRSLPGRGLRRPRLPAEARPAPQARHAHGPPGAEGVSPREGLCQHRPHLGGPAALGLPRSLPHQHHLHEGAVRQRRLPGGPLSTATPVPPLRCSTAPRRPRLSALLQAPTARPGGTAGTGSRFARRRPHRLRPRRHPQPLRRLPDAPITKFRPHHAGRQEGAAAKQHQPLHEHEPRHRQVHRPKRQGPRHQAGGHQ